MSSVWNLTVELDETRATAGRLALTRVRPPGRGIVAEDSMTYRLVRPAQITEWLAAAGFCDLKVGHTPEVLGRGGARLAHVGCSQEAHGPRKRVTK